MILHAAKKNFEHTQCSESEQNLYGTRFTDSLLCHQRELRVSKQCQKINVYDIYIYIYIYISSDMESLTINKILMC